MKFKLLISYRIGFAFLLLLLGIIAAGRITNTIVSKNLSYNSAIKNVFMPSTNLIQRLKTMITDSKLLIKNWVFVDKQENTPDKMKLKSLQEVEYHALMKEIYKLAQKWDKDDKDELTDITLMIDTLFLQQQEVMQQLVTFDDYENPMKILTIIPLVEQGGSIIELADRVEKRLERLRLKHSHKVDKANQKLEVEFHKMQNIISIISIALVMAILIIGIFTLRGIIVPIRYLQKQIAILSKGGLPDKKLKESKDEIGDMTKALNMLIEGLRQKEMFAYQIGSENFNASFTPLSKHDKLGNALLLMKENLKKASEEEQKRRRDDKRRAWIADGINKISAILREDHTDIVLFMEIIVMNIVNYLEVNQGVIYLKEDKNGKEILRLVAAYAYGKRRALKAEMELNEGLMGRCFLEEETIYINDLPETYIKITSGLGESTPRSILLVPLKSENDVLGVIEVASFNDFQQYNIEFVERLSEMVGASIKNLYANKKTNKLLAETKEKSKQLELAEMENKRNIEAIEREKEQMEKRIKQQEEQYKQIVLELEEKIRRINIEHQHEKEELVRKINALKQ